MHNQPKMHLCMGTHSDLYTGIVTDAYDVLIWDPFCMVYHKRFFWPSFDRNLAGHKTCLTLIFFAAACCLLVVEVLLPRICCMHGTASWINVRMYETHA
jgi:hypothetical protein